MSGFEAKPWGSLFDTPQCTIAEKEVASSASSTSSTSKHYASSNSSSDWEADKQVWAIMAALSVCLFVVALDATILTAALPTIAGALRSTATQTFWINTSYLLTAATFQPLFASLGDCFRRRTLLFAALVLFTVGNVLCCVAHNITTLLVGRSIQGIGGGGIFAMNIMILADLIPLRQRSQYTGYMQLVFSVGTIVGPVIGGAFVENSRWRDIFYLNFPFCGIGLIVTPFVVTYDQDTSKISILKIDWIGPVAFTTGMASFLIGVSWGGVQYSWSSAATLCPIILGLAGIVCVFLWERFVSSIASLRLHVFYGRSALAAYLCTLLQSLLLYGTLYYVALWLLTIKDRSPIATGIALLPITCTMIPVSAITGLLITRLARFRWAIWLGWTINVTSIGLLIMFGRKTTTPEWAAVLAVFGFGQGLLLISLNIAIQAIAAEENPENVPVAAAMYAFVRSLGLCLGVAVGGTVFQNMLAAKLGDMGLPSAVASNAEGFVEILKQMPSVLPVKDAYLDAYAWAFKMLFVTLTGISGLGGVLSLLIKSHSLDQTGPGGPAQLMRRTSWASIQC